MTVSKENLTANGFAAFDAESSLKPYSFTRRALREFDVDITIEYCGVCHSDLHQARNEWGGSLYPMVPGHEIVGQVRAIGKGVSAFKVGDRVGVGCLVDSCRTCPSCPAGEESYCEGGFVGTYNSYEKDGKTITQGGYSSRIVVDEKFVLRVPSNLDPKAVAPLLCAGITTYSPLKHWKVGPGVKVGIIGLGGLGHMGIKFARSFGADVTAITSNLKKKDDALRLGAHHVIVSTNDQQMKAHRATFDILLDTVSANKDLSPYLNLLKRDGNHVMVGLPDKPLAVPAFTLIGARRSISGSLIGGIRETQDMLDYCGAHQIVSDIELIDIQDIEKAYKRMVKGDVKYRFVIDLKSLERVK